MSRAKITGIAVCVMVIASLLSFNIFADYAITDLSGYNIVFSASPSYPADFPSYNMFSVDFTSEADTVLKKFNRMIISFDSDTSTWSIVYAVYAEGNTVIQSYRAYKSDIGWASNEYRYVNISGGASHDNTLLLSFVNRNITQGYVNYENATDPYSAVFGEINRYETNVNDLKNVWNQASLVNQAFNISHLAMLAQPLKPFYDYFGLPIIFYGIAITIVCFVKRISFRADNNENTVGHQPYKDSNIGFETKRRIGFRK